MIKAIVWLFNDSGIMELAAIAMIKTTTAKLASNFIILAEFDFLPAISTPSAR